MQLHEQGKTDQAKADLARLAKIKAEREAAQARRKAEAEGEHDSSVVYCCQPKPCYSQSCGDRSEEAGTDGKEQTRIVHDTLPKKHCIFPHVSLASR